MQNYFILFGGWVLGQMILITVNAIRIQRSSKYETGFKEAFGIYFKKDFGPTVLAFIVMVAAMFVLPEAVIHNQTGDLQDKEHSKLLNHIVSWMRAYSILFGIMSQFMGFLMVSKAEKWLKRVVDSNDVKIDFKNINGQ